MIYCYFVIILLRHNWLATPCSKLCHMYIWTDFLSTNTLPFIYLLKSNSTNMYKITKILTNVSQFPQKC